ncbi:MAG: corC 1 [Firmicutes bacterium]|nr:corC 1 [Bacillota bacterium]
MSIWLELIVIIALIFANGIFAMTEMAIVSSRKVRLEQRADEGDKGAKAALELAEEPTPLLSTIQIGITLIGIITGTFGGATLSKPIAEQIKVIPFVGPHAEAISLFVVILSITYFSLIVGELVPKRLALNNPERVASVLARPMRFFSKIAAPIVRFLSASTDILLGLLGIKPSEEPPVTEEEIKILIGQGTEAGTFEKAEQEMIDQVFRLGDLRAYAIMTPRTQLVWLDSEEPLEVNLNIIADSHHSRFPVAKGNLDCFEGIIYSKDIISKTMAGKAYSLSDCVQTPLFIPKTMKVLEILALFQKKGTHDAVVLDEFGGVVGLATIYDIMEEIVGDIPEVDEPNEPQIVQRDNGSWLVDGLLSIDDFKDFFDMDELPGEEGEHYQTVGGLVTSYLGYIPVTSESFETNGLHIEVVDMDRFRVDKVLVTRM